MLLEELVPDYDFGEVHSTRLSAPPEDALGAVTLVELGEMPLVRLLFAVRSIPAYVAGKGGLPSDAMEPLYVQMLEFGFVTVAEEPGQEWVFGGIEQMFKSSGCRKPNLRDESEFLA